MTNKIIALIKNKEKIKRFKSLYYEQINLSLEIEHGGYSKEFNYNMERKLEEYKKEYEKIKKELIIDIFLK